MRKKRKQLPLNYWQAGHRPAIRTLLKRNDDYNIEYESIKALLILLDYKSIKFEKIKRTKELHKWCRDNLGYIHYACSDSMIWFTSEEHRVMFLLRWNYAD